MVNATKKKTRERTATGGPTQPVRPKQPGGRSVALLYENEAWNVELAASLEAEGLKVRPIDLRRTAFGLDEPLPDAVYFNRLSPSAASRGNAPALDLGRVLVRKLEGEGQEVVNGSEAFEHELSKLRQYIVLRNLGLPVPRTVVLTPDAEPIREARELLYPAILKPNTGGSGAGVAIVEDFDEALARVRTGSEEHGSWLLQEKVEPADGSVLRLELIGDELVYAMRVHAVNTFNLCPAESCVRPPVDARIALEPEVRFELEERPPEVLVDAARHVMRTIGLEVGGVEVMIDESQRPVFIDVNATSTYRKDVAAAAGVDPYSMLAGYLREKGAGVRAREVA